MSQTDPVGDMLASIKNVIRRGHAKMVCPHSRLKESVARVLKEEGYLQDVQVTDAKEAGSKLRHLHLFMKYDESRKPIMRHLKRISTPGRRVFRGVRDLGKVLDGLGVTVLSTSRGVMSDRRARKERLGGEIICKVW